MQNTLLAGAGVTKTNDIGNPALGQTLQGIANLGGPADFFNRLLPAGVGLVFVVGSVVFFFMLVVGAIQWIASGGDKNGLESAKGKLTSALIGIVILFGSFAIIKLVEVFFGIKILTIDIGPLIIQ